MPFALLSQIELSTGVMPAASVCLKNTGKNATITVVANAEFAQSYRAQANTFLSKNGDFMPTLESDRCVEGTRAADDSRPARRRRALGGGVKVLPRIEPRLRVALQLAASLALLAFLISRLDWQRSLTLLRGAQPLLLVAVIAIQTADRLLMALKWHQLLRVLDARLTHWHAIRIYYESTFIGFALPLGGLGPDIVRFCACEIAALMRTLRSPRS
jgi:hypothetical protein